MQVGELAGVSQTFVSQAERRLGTHASIETWASLAAAVGVQLAAFFETVPGSTPPRDLVHLRRQQAVIETGGRGGWRGRPEVAITAADGSQRFVDVLLERGDTREAIVVEIVDLIVDFGEDVRGLQRKIDAIQAGHPAWDVHGLLVVRATVRNRAVIRELGALVGSRFVSGMAWMRALTTAAPVPDDDAIMWSGSQSVSLMPMRLPKRSSSPSDRGTDAAQRKKQ